MFDYIKRKIQESRKKKSFQEYKFQVVDFQLAKDGTIQYAQWLHPGEFGNEVHQENVDFYRQFINPGDFVIDIGANEGDTTVPMALAAGKNGVTLAIEPNPHVFKILEVNASLNKERTTIIPLNFAATGYDGEFTFGSGDPSFGNGGIVGFTHNQKRNIRYTFTVTGKNIEYYLYKNYAEFLSRISFIKIDAEGFDKEIIKTLPKIISNCRPYLVTECFGPSTTDEKVELFDLLVQKNYAAYRLPDFTLKSEIKIGRKDMTGKKTFDILAIPTEKKSVK